MLKTLRSRILIFLAVLGPGFITANVDNDAGGIYTYSQAGARWGYLPLWTLIPITIALILVQEMCSRMGAVTGKGLSDLIHHPSFEEDHALFARTHRQRGCGYFGWFLGD